MYNDRIASVLLFTCYVLLALHILLIIAAGLS